MKVALPWSRDERLDSLTDEYYISFSNKSNKFEDLLEFLQKHQNARFNLKINTSEYDFDISKLRILNAVHPQLYVVTDYSSGEYKKLKEMGIKFYFSPNLPIDSFRLLEYIVSLGATDVYIMDDLCYSLEKVRRFCNQHNVRARLVLNRIPSMREDAVIDVRSPWFIPETVDELAKYIDVVEFDENLSKARLMTLYKIWFEKKEWRENLKAILPQLEIDIFNQSMIPDFTIYKMNCGYRCAYGSACKKCDQFKEMADNLYAKHIEYVPPKEEKEG